MLRSCLRLLLGDVLGGVSATAQASESFTTLLVPFIEKQAVAGVAGIVIGKEGVLWRGAIGFADIEAQEPMREDHMFWIASQSKSLVAVSIMMLVDEGKVALDDPVERYLPEFKGQRVVTEGADGQVVLKKPSHPITVREILSHVSGLPALTHVADAVALDEMVRICATNPLANEPRTNYGYTNAGPNAAARIIEVVSGVSYEAFVQERLLDPLGMHDTTFWPTPNQIARLATPYRRDPETGGLVAYRTDLLTFPLTDREKRYAEPAGGLFSTAGDVARFCQMLLNGGELEGKRYLSQAALDEFAKRQTPEAVGVSYGLGFEVEGTGWFGHAGAMGTKMEIYPDKGVAVVWMVQYVWEPRDVENAQGVFLEWAVRAFGESDE